MSGNEALKKVGVVAGDPLRSLGMQAILEESGDLKSVGLTLAEVDSAEDLAAVLLDSSCAGNLLDTVARFRVERPALPVVVVGESLDGLQIQAIIAAGAKGYLPGTANEAEIHMAMQVVLDGSVWAPRKVMARLIEAGGVAVVAQLDAPRIADRMTPRENDVLDLLLAGRSNRQIAASMGVGAVTVKAHLGRMLRKAGVKNRVELTLKAINESKEELEDE